MLDDEHGWSGLPLSFGAQVQDWLSPMHVMVGGELELQATKSPANVTSDRHGFIELDGITTQIAIPVSMECA